MLKLEALTIKLLLYKNVYNVSQVSKTKIVKRKSYLYKINDVSTFFQEL